MPGHVGSRSTLFKVLAIFLVAALVILFTLDEIGMERFQNKFVLKISRVRIHVDFRNKSGAQSDQHVPYFTNSPATVALRTSTAVASSQASNLSRATRFLQHIPTTESVRLTTTTSTTTSTTTTTSAATTSRITVVTTGTSATALATSPTTTNISDYQRNNSVACKFPVLDPFDQSILKYIDHPSELKCKRVQPDLTYLDIDGYVNLNATEVERLNETGLLQCFLRTIDRAEGNSDNSLARGNPQSFVNDIRINFPKTDVASVTCTYSNDSSYYFNLHAHPLKLEKKILDATEDQLSIFMFILDSVSLSMFRRHLPSTYKFLTETMGLRVFMGYTKVADNTYPNMVPILTGRRAYTQQPGMPDEAQAAPGNQFDDWDIIWKHYAKKGYATSFVEDRPQLGLFHYLASGFKKKPVDHWMRPFFLARRASALAGKSQSFCFGNTPEYASQADISLRLLREYKTKRSFQYSFYTYITHDYCCQLESVDSIFLNFFETIHKESLLNRSMMMVMSDHGHRFAGLRATLVGLIEERMPIYGLYFPPWFYKKHPNVDVNLRTNQWRLSAPFDIYQTFWDILTGNFTGQQLKKGTRGLSQLYEIHADRNCTEAGIPEHYCVCAQPKEIDIKEKVVGQVANFIIEKLNKDLANVSDQCEKLSLDKVHRAESGEVNQKVVHGVKGADAAAKFNETVSGAKMRIVRVLLSAKPSDAMFEASVHVNLYTNVLTVPNDVSRINKYGDQSKCMTDPRLRRYCYCKK